MRLPTSLWIVYIATWTTAALLAAFACASDEPAPRNLVIVVVDTLRADRVGVYGADRDTTPSLDAFARDGARFDRAYSAAPWTQPAVASMFTGLHPSGHGLVHLGGRIPRAVPTLPEVLQSQGFATGAVVSHVLVGRRYGFARGFESFDQHEAGGHEAISTAGVTERAMAMLEDLQADGRRFFLFVHYFDPHYSYHHHPSVGFAPEREGRLQGGEAIEFLWWIQERMSDAELSHLKALYDEEIRHTDAGLGRLLEALEGSGRFDDSVVVVTADHGEELLERTRIGHAASVYEELVRVPLVLRTPRGKGRVIDTPVSTAALAPTMFDLLDLRVPELRTREVSFAPLLAGPPSEGRALVYSETQWFAQKESVTGPRYKLIRDRISGKTELYDLTRDAAERVDLAAREPQLVARMAAELDAHLDSQRALAHPAAPAPLDSEQRELLRGLGYLEDATPGPGEAAADRHRAAAP